MTHAIFWDDSIFFRSLFLGVMTLLTMIKGCDCMPILQNLPFDGFGFFLAIIEVGGNDWDGSIRTCSPWHAPGIQALQK